jgi:hypothetical protein
VESVKEKEGRAKISWESGSMTMDIPSRKSIFFIIFIGVWLVMWGFGAAAAISTILQGRGSGPNAFMIFWLTGWTFGGIYALLLWLWNIFGNEIVTVNSLYLKISTGIGKLRYNRQYDMNQVKKLRVVSMPIRTWNQEDFMPFRSGRISFDYGMRTYRFATGIDEAEAAYIIDLFKSRGLIRE